MRRAPRLSIASGVILLVSIVATAFAQKTITAAEAKLHVGEVATVCDFVASTHYAASSRGRPTFLNLAEPYPNQTFTILIWGEDRVKFGVPETRYREQSVCVSGMISSYRGTPEIVAREPGDIKIATKK